MASDPPSLAHRTGLRRSPHLPAAVIVAVGFLARLAWMLHVRPMPVSDFNDYRTLALGIIDHLQFGYPEPTAFFLPVHPTFLAGFALISLRPVAGVLDGPSRHRLRPTGLPRWSARAANASGCSHRGRDLRSLPHLRGLLPRVGDRAPLRAADAGSDLPAHG